VEPYHRNLHRRIVSAGGSERVYHSFTHGTVCTCQTVRPSSEPCEHIKALDRVGLLVVLRLHAGHEGTHETPSEADRAEHASWGSQDAIYGVEVPSHGEKRGV
jgi:hypothetical protein